MPEAVAACGVDEALWSTIKNKRGLVKIAASGDIDHLKKRIESLKALIANAPQAPTPQASHAVAAKGAGRKAGNVKAAKRQQSLQRKEGPYEQFGTIPDGFDAAAITAQVNERLACKVAKDYERADEIRDELKAKGIRIRDDFRTWSYKPLA